VCKLAARLTGFNLVNVRTLFLGTWRYENENNMSVENVCADILFSLVCWWGAWSGD
jgi:hypothetical protein